MKIIYISVSSVSALTFGLIYLYWRQRRGKKKYIQKSKKEDCDSLKPYTMSEMIEKLKNDKNDTSSSEELFSI